MSLKLNQNQIEKIIQLINWFITEIKFKQTSLQNIIQNCCEQKNFESLSFLNSVNSNMKTMPFPKAWEHAVNGWQSVLTTDDKNLLKSLSQILGAFDVDGQISELKHINFRFEESFSNAKVAYEKKSKLAKSLGILLGLAIYIVLI